jgi:bisphosphoglycerate-independent phosphoglycerate mutase (AlkP superfamily)
MSQEATAEVDLNEQTGEVRESLTALDRCDVCGAQAYIRVELASGDLVFCSHHGNENKAQLEPVAVSWHDESSKLLVR